MYTTKYSKLVRDRIPEIIESSGKSCICEVLTDEHYIEMLDAKLNEELGEYQESKSMEELADLLEVVRAVALARGSSFEEIEAIRKAKAEKRGAFEKKLLLKEVRDPLRHELIYTKTVDWSLFKDGFAIPQKVQEYFQSSPILRTNPGETRDISLIIDGKQCSAELRNLPIDRKKNPKHAPILQIRYHSSDNAAETFRAVFARCWKEMHIKKQSSTSKVHVRSKEKNFFRMYATEEPARFLIECYPSKESDFT